MKRQFKRALSCVLAITLLLALGGIPAFAANDKPVANLSDSATVEALKAEIIDLYSSETGLVGRTNKMQAFIMELALHAKTINPDFKIIPQDGINLAFVDGDSTKGLHEGLISLVDGWGIEGMVGTGSSITANATQQKYITLVEAGVYVSDTTVCDTQAKLDNYYARAEAWGIIPYPRIAGELSESLFPEWRWAENGDYFWVEDPDDIGLGDRIEGTRDVYDLTDAQNYLYNINSRPYDAWETWDDEEAAALADDGDGDRTRIYDSYGCGLLVPSVGGQYVPAEGDDGDPDDIVAVIAEYGDEWDWWWKEAGLEEDAGRATWIEALKNSDYDVIYIDSFYNHRALPDVQTPLTAEEVEYLKTKSDGSRRQVIAYLSVGSAEQNRWYCQDDWVYNDPDNLNSYRNMKAGIISGSTYTPPGEGVPVWLSTGYGGGYQEEAVVQWWHQEWRDIIINGGGIYANKATGDNTSSIDRIIAQGFDGVYLDNVGVYSRGAWNTVETYWANNDGVPGEPVVSTFTFTYTEENVIDGSVPNEDNTIWSAETKVLPNHKNTITVPNVTVPVGMRASWTVTASQDPAYEIGDVVANPSRIVAVNDITFDLTFVLNIGGGTTTSKIAVETPKNGSVSVSNSNPQNGEKVTITTAPGTNYEVGSVTVTDSNGSKLPVTNNGDGTYSFVYGGNTVSVNVSFVLAGTANPFKDVKNSDWFYDDVMYCYNNSLMNGTDATSFSPDMDITRGMIATIVWRLEGEPKATSANPFTDVAKGSYYETAIAWAAEHKIVEGYGGGTFGPENNITREQFAVILYRYCALNKIDVTKQADLSSFKDASGVSGYAVTAVKWAVAEGLLKGNGDGTLNPTGGAKRSEAAALLHRFCENIVK